MVCTQLRLPPLRLEQVTADFYTDERLLVVVAPVRLDGTAATASTASGTKQVTSSVPVSLRAGRCAVLFDPDSELSIAHEPRAGTTPSKVCFKFAFHTYST